MDDAKRRLIAEWLQRARHDLRSAERLMQPPPILDTAVYHCQQAVEKALKGYLASQDEPIRKTHDLTLLIERCMDFDSRFNELVELCEVLTPYGTEFRYPGSNSLPQNEDASAALNMARQALAMVQRIIDETNCPEAV